MAEPDWYPYIKVHKVKKCAETDLFEIYRFKNAYNHTFLVEIFSYKHNLFVVKFYQKSHYQSPNRYSYQYDPKFIQKLGFNNGARNFLKTMKTVARITLSILERNKTASFGFMGAPSPFEKSEENSESLNPDGTIAETIRSRVYYSFCIRYFSSEVFEFIPFETASILILKNKSDNDFTTEIAEDYINNEILPSLHLTPTK